MGSAKRVKREKLWYCSFNRPSRITNNPPPYPTAPERGRGGHFHTVHFCCAFVHPDFDSAPSFVGMREMSIGTMTIKV